MNLDYSLIEEEQHQLQMEQMKRGESQNELSEIGALTNPVLAFKSKDCDMNVQIDYNEDEYVLPNEMSALNPIYSGSTYDTTPKMTPKRHYLKRGAQLQRH